MRLFKTTLLTWAFSLLFLSATMAQSYTTRQLPPPSVASSIGTTYNGSTIIYGAIPPSGRNNPVIVYVHGFSDTHTRWFQNGNQYYNLSYNANYRTAFVSMTRGNGMWINGDILADMLDDITQHYNVNDVIIVAHSNGGKASEVAMITHNRRNKVNRVISLGTPFKGTPLANIGEAPGLNLILDLIGLSGGASTSTTYYMQGVARPLLDWNWRNQPGKFINFGSWGFYNGITIAKVAMVVSGGVLSILGAGPSNGGNDGVTPYWSSTRPWGRPQWIPGHGNPISEFDHMDLAESVISWNAVSNVLTAPLSSLRTNPNQVAAIGQEPTLQQSSLQITSTLDDNRTFTVESSAINTMATLFHANKQDQFELYQVAETGEQTLVNLDWSTALTAKAYLGGYNTQISLDQLEAGTYKFASNSPVAALVSMDNSVIVTYDNARNYIYEAGESFEVTLKNTKRYDLSQAKVTAIITHKNDLEGEPVKEATVSLENFTAGEDGSYTLTPTTNFAEGVYNMVIRVEHPEFKRDLVSGFAVKRQAQTTNIAEAANATEQLQVAVFPNPTTDVAQVSFESVSNTTLTLFDVNGRVLLQRNIAEKGLVTEQIDLNALDLSVGTYFVEVATNGQKSARILTKK